MAQQPEAKCVCGRKAGVECGRVDCANRRPLTAAVPDGCIYNAVTGGAARRAGLSHDDARDYTERDE